MSRIAAVTCWFQKRSKRVRLLLSLATIFFGIFVTGNCFGLMMGDPFSAEAKAIQARWAPLAFYVGCPVGLALTALGIKMFGLKPSEPL